MISNKEQNIRVEDYLNDKLQTSADFENLDTLLEIVKNQQTILKEQVKLWHAKNCCESNTNEVAAT